VASAVFAVPVTVGRSSGEERFSAQPDPMGGGWVQFASPKGMQLARIDEQGALTRVALPAELRGEDLELMALQDGWTVATNRYWPGGRREEERCSPGGYEGVPEQEKNCGVIVVAQYSPSGHWTATQRLAHSSGTQGGEPAAVESGGRIELAWRETNGEADLVRISVADARAGHPFGPAHSAQRARGNGSESEELSTVRGQLYLRVLYGPAPPEDLLERRLYGDGRLGPPHLLQSGALANYRDQALPGPHGSEILVYQDGEDVELARRDGWASEYQAPSAMTMTAETGFQVAESGNDELLISVRSFAEGHLSVVAAEASRSGSLSATDTVEYDPLNSFGDYTWAGAIDDAGQALIASLDLSTGDGIWLHPSAPGCAGFSARIPLIEKGGSNATALPRDDADLTAFAGPRNVFHLAWITPSKQVQSTTVRVQCATGGSPG
jgi:hypothetical protein